MVSYSLLGARFHMLFLGREGQAPPTTLSADDDVTLFPSDGKGNVLYVQKVSNSHGVGVHGGFLSVGTRPHGYMWERAALSFRLSIHFVAESTSSAVFSHEG